MKLAVFFNLPDGGAKRILFEQIKFLSKKHDLDLYTYTKTHTHPFDIEDHTRAIYRYKFSLDHEVKGVKERLTQDFKIVHNLKDIHQKIALDIDKRDYNAVLVHPDIITESPFLLRYLHTPTLYYCEELLRVAYEQILQLGDGVSVHKRLYEQNIRSIKKEIDKQNASSASVISTSSKFMKNNISKAYKRKSIVCYPGVSTSIFRNSKKTNSKLLFIGNKEKIDGYPLLKKIQKRLGAKMRIEILDFKEGKAKVNNDMHLSKKYSESLTTMCLDYSEPFGLKAIESMSCETPVLAVNEGGYKETVIDGVSGFLLPRIPQAFVEKIEMLDNDPERVEEMGRVGRTHVQKNFTWEKHGRCVEQLLSKL